MDIVILNSAFKHKISRLSILYCLLHFHNNIVMGHPPLIRLFVIHAMKLRKQIFYLLKEGAV